MNGASKVKSWGDYEDEDEVRASGGAVSNAIQERHVLSENIKGQKVRTTTRYRMKQVKNRVSDRVIARRKIERFGDAKEGEENVTLLSRDFVTMDHPDDQLTDDVDDPTLKNTLQGFVMRQQERAMNRELDEENEVSNETNVEVTPAESNKNNSSYVPPSQRGRVGGSATTGANSGIAMLSNASDDNTLRVSNLTKNVTEDDLRELFEPFGRVHRVYLPRAERMDGNRILKEPKGFAFIAYLRKEDAEKAMERLNGYGYDHLILKVEWAKPTKDGGSGGGGGLSGGYVSGYGKQLAQDTKEKVTYASNLTGNK